MTRSRDDAKEFNSSGNTAKEELEFCSWEGGGCQRAKGIAVQGFGFSVRHHVYCIGGKEGIRQPLHDGPTIRHGFQ